MRWGEVRMGYEVGEVRMGYEVGMGEGKGGI